jgi:predicted nicotinamide N-methyase
VARSWDVRPSIDDLDDDALIEYGASLELELTEIKAARAEAVNELAAERPRLRRAAIKLSVNAVVATIGIAATPLTFGLSLFLTAISISVLTWDGVDYAKDHGRHTISRRRLRELSDYATEVADELAAVHEALDARAGTDETR